MRFRCSLALLLLALAAGPAIAGQSIARRWNEELLIGIRGDVARPPIHARTLFHFAIAAYDAWAAYDTLGATPYLLGHRVGGFTCPFVGVPCPVDIQAARDEAISYAEYRLLSERFRVNTAGGPATRWLYGIMESMGYDTSFASTDYTTGSPAALGNYIAQSVIALGLQDGSNEQGDYAYQHYSPYNPALYVFSSGDSTLIDPNRWQPLRLFVFIDQSGQLIVPGGTPKFIAPEWGNVTPFALDPNTDLTRHERGGVSWPVWDDPGPPPMLDTLDADSPSSRLYKWGYELVAAWSSHLKAADSVMVDVSPASIGNLPHYPITAAALPAFYDLEGGGDRSHGRPFNPRTGQPYVPEYVPRGDYARVISEFWADGPTSETPPGHWFVILNGVGDDPRFVKRLGGEGAALDDLEWDVKAYFALGGALHDAAIACWSIKGYYDAIRPVTAIRWMAMRGQSSDRALPHYSPLGLPLKPGYVELVQHGDSLAGANDENVGRVKLLAWRGPTSIRNPDTDAAGVGWVFAEKWWPYQRPSFVTPPFAGYTSGHSTYSRAAAEVLTRITGDEYFPGGLGEFVAPRNSYLVFEEGPSVDVRLQWATYRDAADQCSLSRIWGGIHPPQDDIPGRLIGRRIGQAAVDLAERYFSATAHVAAAPRAPATPIALAVYPNPVRAGRAFTVQFDASLAGHAAELFSVAGQRVASAAPADPRQHWLKFKSEGLRPGVYMLRVNGASGAARRLVVMR